MTEAEWLNCVKPDKMLDFVRSKVTDRKLRLLAVACVRRVWHRENQLPEQIEAAERFADREISIEELRAIRSFLGARGGFSAAWAANNALHAVLEEVAEVAAQRAVRHASDFIYFFTIEQRGCAVPGVQAEAMVAKRVECRELAVTIRECLGNPFQSTAPDSSLLAWNDGAVRKMAQVIYDDRAFDRLPLLADALEDAGCDTQEILDHCRSNGEHVRGCWVVDLLLGKS